MHVVLSSALTCSAFTHLVLFTTVFLAFIYVFNWPCPVEGKSKEAFKFDWHPVLMVSAFVLFLGESIIAYRMLPFAHSTQKLIHFLLHSSALLLSSAAVYLIVTFHSVNDIPHFYTIHSLLGLAAYALFVGQYSVGVAAFFFPRLPESARSTLMPFHRYVGVIVFLLCWFAMLTGLMDRQRIDTTPAYSQPYQLANALGMFIAVSGAVIIYHFSPVAKEKTGDQETRERLLP